MATIGPKDLAASAGMILFKAGQPLAAAIVYAEAAKLAFDDPAILLGLGASVGNSAGVLVVAPFVQWSTRTLKRCLVVASDGPYAKVARERLETLREKKEFQDLPPIEASDLDELLDFLDIDPQIVVQAIDDVAKDDQMSVVMALGDLAQPRFVPVIAAAIEGRWGGGPARSALKRMGRFAGRRSIRDALAALRAGPLAEECGPYLEFAERHAASVEPEPDPPPPARKAASAPSSAARNAAAAPSPGAREPEPAPAAKPWWKVW